jgi:3-dehydroquinate synthase
MQGQWWDWKYRLACHLQFNITGLNNDRENVQVKLQRQSYAVRIGPGVCSEVFQTAENLIQKNSKCVLITSPAIAQAQPDLIKKFSALMPVAITQVDGEKAKSSEELLKLWNFLASHGIARDGAVFALGGGVVGDLAGFTAATYQRGIQFIQVPTTLLAMVDSSVGGKTGINLDAGKILVGSFHQPIAVFADTSLLSTLPAREFAAGIAEVIKHGLIADKKLLVNCSHSHLFIGKVHNSLPLFVDALKSKLRW